MKKPNLTRVALSSPRDNELVACECGYLCLARDWRRHWLKCEMPMTYGYRKPTVEDATQWAKRVGESGR